MKRVTKTAEKFGKILLIFMLSISQISFPLEVLADELNEKVEEAVQVRLTEKEKTTENDGDDSTENDGDDSTENDGDDSTENDGDDSTENDGDDSTENDGDDSTENERDDNILSPYTELRYIDGTYYVKGGKELLTVTEVLSNFDTEAIETELALKLSITNLENETLEDLDVVKNNYQLVITDNTEQTETYLIKIEGDYNEDSFVDEKDAQSLVDKILNNETNKLNEDKPFDILDATNPVFTTGSWNFEINNQDTLTNSLQNKEEIAVGEELVVKYYINGFEFDTLTGIQGKINYDKTLLKLTNIEIDHLYGDMNEEGKFAYLLDNYQSNDILMTLTFTSISAGKATISIDEIIASTGIEAGLDNNSISTTVTILDYGKGGDVEEVETTPTTTTSEQTIEAPQQTVSTPTTTSTSIVKRVALSSDNFIKSLTIKGYDIKFDQNTYEYSIKVKNSVKSLNLIIELNDETASYIVEGNKNFKVGENTVTITVTAENGSTKTYTIKVNREEETEDTTEEEIEEESGSSKTIVIILIVLVIIGLIYVIFKDDEEDKKESKK